MTVTTLLGQTHHQIYADSDSRLQPITERANQTINYLDSAQGVTPMTSFNQNVRVEGLRWGVERPQ